ncbi:MAG: cation:proton antiporter [Microbacteriaceae bacterium]
MTFATLALVLLVGLLGPIVAGRRSWNIPVVVGELLAGVAIGASGFGLVDASEQTFRLLANIGFGLTMFVVGSRVPLHDPGIKATLTRGVAGAVIVGAVAAGLGAALSAVFGTGHAALYAVLIASSSAALILPIMTSLKLTGNAVLRLTVQVAVADVVCIVALPLAIDPAHAGPATLGTLGIAAVAGVLFIALRLLDRRGALRRFHVWSERRRFALELRVSLLLLFAFGALAQFTHVSIMLAGFALGLVVGSVGEPRRLARQLFGITDGFFGPLFFVWLGASINLHGLAAHPGMIVLGLCLGGAAVVAHLAARAVGLPWLLTLISAGQLGVPIAAATIGVQSGLLVSGEDAAILLGALVTVAITAGAASIYARRPRMPASRGAGVA